VPLAGPILPPEQWVQTALKRLPEEQPLDLDELFGRSAPRIVDIGCGNGRFVLASAVRRPECDHIGVDPLPLVIRYATRRANQRGLANCRFAVSDGLKFLQRSCPPDSLTELHVYHPQPYQRASDVHKRLFTGEFLRVVHSRLQRGGRLYVQTDNPAYWEYLNTILPELFQWQVQAGAWPEDPLGRSRREIIAIHKGLPIFRGIGQRRDDLAPEVVQQICEALPAPVFRATPKRNPRAWRRPGR
jgi:tRNA (guanine-N7-)-methyltransferase